MNKDDKIHQQNIFDSTGLLPKRNWKTALWHVALLVVVVFLTEISGAQADMVFDFQMKLAQKGNAEAQFKVGEMYETGRGVEKNMVEAKRWITRAAEQGHQAANYKLLYYDLQNNGVTARNKPKLTELQQEAKDGNGIAQYYVGLMQVLRPLKPKSRTSTKPGGSTSCARNRTQNARRESRKRRSARKKSAGNLRRNAMLKNASSRKQPRRRRPSRTKSSHGSVKRNALPRRRGQNRSG